MENDYQIIELNKDVDDKFWLMRLDFYMQHKKPSDLSYTDIADYQQRFFELTASNESYRNCLVLVNEDLVAAFNLQLTKADKDDQEICIYLNNSNKDLTNELVKAVLRFTSNRISGDYNLNLHINCPIDQEFCNQFKLKIKWAVDVCLLKRENINTALVKDYQQKVKSQNPDLRLELFTELPDELIDEYAALYTELYNDLPKLEMPITENITGKEIRETQANSREKGDIYYRLLIFNSANNIVAKSYIRISKRAANYPYQCMTGVKKKYRGRGLGKWLKTVMYPMIFAKHPEVEGIITDMFPYNKYIQKINSEIGFEKIDERRAFVMIKEEFNKLRMEN